MGGGEDRVNESQRPLADLAVDLLDGAEAEIYDIGSTLHNDAFQAMTAAGLLLDQARRTAAGGNVQRTATLAERAHASVVDAQRTILAVAVRAGAALGGMGDMERSLSARLRVAGLQQRVRVAAPLGVGELPEHMEPMLQRLIWWMIQEAAERTAGAMVLSIRCLDGERVVASLEEDGPAPSKPCGVAGWARDRARVAGGSLTRDVRQGRLTTTLEIPLRRRRVANHSNG
jgi:hypothetical protein